jgi:GNAT superfamily N-acetyltransferase
MTISIDPNPGVRLYAHEPSILIPILQLHQPRSLPVLSSIYENLSIPQPKSTGTGTGCDVVWTTFPSDRLPGNNDEEKWAVIIRMQEFERVHLRFYCSAEQSSSEASDEELEFVRGVSRGVVEIYGMEIMLGAIDSRWNEVMRGVVDARELVECAVFLAPSMATAGVGAGENEGKGDEEVFAALGLEVDRARDEDMSIVSSPSSRPPFITPIFVHRDNRNYNYHLMDPTSKQTGYRRANTQIQSTCDVPRPLAYYASRSSQSTVIRHKITREAVCWIILHADGSIGALYTLPKWRRKGLAEIVVRQNIKSRQAMTKSSERRDFCYVFKGNTASERLWVKMGWEEGWGVRWIVNRKVEEARGKVERFSHPDER